MLTSTMVVEVPRPDANGRHLVSAPLTQRSNLIISALLGRRPATVTSDSRVSTFPGMGDPVDAHSAKGSEGPIAALCGRRCNGPRRAPHGQISGLVVSDVSQGRKSHRPHNEPAGASPPPQCRVWSGSEPGLCAAGFDVDVVSFGTGCAWPVPGTQWGGAKEGAGTSRWCWGIDQERTALCSEHLFSWGGLAVGRVALGGLVGGVTSASVAEYRGELWHVSPGSHSHEGWLRYWRPSALATRLRRF